MNAVASHTLESGSILVVSTATSLATIFLAQAGTIDPGTAVTSLAIYGPLGIMCGLLWYRNRERDREHAQEMKERDAALRFEREAAWEAHRLMADKLSDVNETLTAIKTILTERRNE